MSETGNAILCALQELHAATPEPPAAGTEPDEVLARAGTLLAAREQPLRDLAAAIDRDPHVLRQLAGATELHAGVQERAAAWHAALAQARHQVGQRVQAVSRLRQRSRP